MHWSKQSHQLVGATRAKRNKMHFLVNKHQQSCKTELYFCASRPTRFKSNYQSPTAKENTKLHVSFASGKSCGMDMDVPTDKRHHRNYPQDNAPFLAASFLRIIFHEILSKTGFPF